jgi:DICT domain-containing protein
MSAFPMALAAQSLAAEPDAPAAHQWKLTLGAYRYAGYSGTDFNLRW